MCIKKRNFSISVGIYHDGVGEIGFIYDVMEEVLYSAKRGEGAYKNGERLPKLQEEVPLKRAILGMNHYWLCKNRVRNEHVMQDLAKTVRGLRTYGSAALEFAYVAEGLLDGYMAMSLAPWDIAAGIIIVHETGGKTTDINGRKLDLLQKSPILTCNPSLQKKFIVMAGQRKRMK
ncbi:inositol monophosphatase family protein [Virgibacillus halophilus]|uniref:inositol-phosphate phosphatase n=1 Tax=Tigheibacillus halophilus TaxID=361280 RepID=A0ABU5CBM3_9BACI|nr:inositol monophosphatase family protein [Virgibacillus halophilus]